MKKNFIIILLCSIFLISCGKQQNSKQVKKDKPNHVKKSDFGYFGKIENASLLREKLNNFKSTSELEYFMETKFIEVLIHMEDKISYFYGYFNIKENKINDDSKTLNLNQLRIEQFLNQLKYIENTTYIDDYFVQMFFMSLTDLFDWREAYVNININLLTDYLSFKINYYTNNLDQINHLNDFLFYYQKISHIIYNRDNKKELFFSLYSNLFYKLNLNNKLNNNKIGKLFIDSFELFCNSIDKKSLNEKSILFSNLKEAFIGINFKNNEDLTKILKTSLMKIQSVLLFNEDVLINTHRLYKKYFEDEIISKYHDILNNLPFDKFWDSHNALLFNIYIHFSIIDIETKISNSNKFYENLLDYYPLMQILKEFNEENILKNK